MKKQTKRVLGFCGLALVGVMTALACFVPSANTTATSGSSTATDTINVRVVTVGPDMTLSGITNGKPVVTAGQAFQVGYHGVKSFQATLTFTDQDGNTHTKTFEEEVVDYADGEKGYNINLKDLVGDDGYPFGYGPYVLSVAGFDSGGVVDTDAISFDYLPVVAEVTKDEETGKYYLDVEYDEEDVEDIEIKIYDENGNVVLTIDPTDYPTKRIELPFDEYGLADGTYTIEVTAYGKDGSPLFRPFSIKVNYETKAVPVPDTGGFMQDLNISKTDYLITGILVFVVAVVIGVTLILRSGKSTRNRR